MSLYKEHFQTFFVVFRRPVVKARLVRSPDKDGHGGDVKVFSLFPPLFGLCMDDTLDSFCLLLLATFGSWQEHLERRAEKKFQFPIDKFRNEERGKRAVAKLTWPLSWMVLILVRVLGIQGGSIMGKDSMPNLGLGKVNSIWEGTTFMAICPFSSKRCQTWKRFLQSAWNDLWLESRSFIEWCS